MKYSACAHVSLFAFLALPAVLTGQIHHYEYVFPPNQIVVYDIDNNFAPVKTIPIQTGPLLLGSVASAATGMLYISYGSNFSSGGSLLKYDLVKDQVVWAQTYPFGIDSMSISPDGSKIYMPTGENNSGGLWMILDAASGSVLGSIDSGGSGPHNTVLNPSGTHLYMASIRYDYLVEADTTTQNVIQRIGPTTTSGGTGVRPFTINGSETLAFMTVTSKLGFLVGDIATGQILYTVPIQGFTSGTYGSSVPSHGISISPDETELYLRDTPHEYVHVYDISGLPGTAPKQVADIPLMSKTGNPGWLHHSRDGHYVFVGDSGDVIDTTKRKWVANIPALGSTARSIEIDFQNGVPVWAMSNRSSLGNLTSPASADVPTFHGDRQRTGWQQHESILDPQTVSSGKFGPIWNSPAFDASGSNPAHTYASPLYLESVTMSSGPYAGGTFSVVLAATSNDFVYAVNAFTANFGSTQVPAGTILWSRSLGTPASNTNPDNVPLGVLGTPIVDRSASPPRLYVVGIDAVAGHRLFALDVTSGSVLPGWPVALNDSTLSPVNQNGPSLFHGQSTMSQRGALNLSPDGKTLYVAFGSYIDQAAGWLVAVDTQAGAVLSAFSGAPASSPTANAGMWASSGVAIDSGGRVFATTGNGSTGNETTPGYWGNSLLAFNPGSPLTLLGTYTPFNYCQMDESDSDVAGGGPMLIPTLSDTGSSTPDLVTFGGKQGNIYLVNRDALPGSLTVRPGCGSDASLDLSLLPPGNQPQFGTPGPLNVFGPYSETDNDKEYAKARSTPAFWRAADGTPYLFVTGSNKSTATSQTSVPPGIYRLKIVNQPAQPAYLQVDGFDDTVTFLTPGSPVVTSNGSMNPVVWVLVANIPRTQALNTPSSPFLVAFDALTFQRLYQSNPGDLNVGGKYNTPVIAHGVVFVATDRIQAFGPNSTPIQTAPVINSFAAAPTTIISKQSSTLSWNVTGATALSISVVGKVTPVTTGSHNVSPTTTTTYTLTATAKGGTSTATATVNVNPPPPVITSFKAAPATVLPGAPVTLTWATTGTVSSLSIDPGVGTVTGTSKIVNPAATTTYTLTASNSGGLTTKPVTVNVTSVPAVSLPFAMNVCGPTVANFVAEVASYETGGNCTTISSSVNVTGVANAAPATVYTTKRTGQNGVGYTYTIPLPTPASPGQLYTVRLHFADDLSTATGQRVFNIAINGQVLLSNFDVFAIALQKTKAVVQDIANVAANANNQIVIQGQYGKVGNPLLNGLEIIPNP